MICSLPVWSSHNHLYRIILKRELSSVYREIITTRKRSLRKGNVFTHVCHSVHGGDMHGGGACMAGGLCGGACMARGRVVGMHGRGVYMAGACIAGGMYGWGHAWQGGMCGRGASVAGGQVWQGVCMAGEHAW